MSYQDHLRSDSTGLTLGEVLRDSPTGLLGVDAAHVLDTLGIHAVFDLAASSTFGGAATVLRTETEPVAGDGQLINEGRSLDDRNGAVAGTAKASHEAAAAEGNAGPVLALPSAGPVLALRGKLAGSPAPPTRRRARRTAPPDRRRRPEARRRPRATENRGATARVGSAGPS